MWDLENRYGSLFRALWTLRRKEARDRTRSVADSSAPASLGAPSGRLTSFIGGMEELPQAVVRTLGGRVWTGAQLIRIRVGGNGQRYLLDVQGCPEVEADAVVLAGPAEVSARLISSLDDQLADALREIRSASLAVVCLGYNRAAFETASGPLDGFGFLVAPDEGIRALGVLWDSSIYDGRAPSGTVLLRAMVGGAGDPNPVLFEDSDLVDIARRTLRQTMGVWPEPIMTRVIRHRSAIPQYTVGHLDRLARIDARLERHPGLFVAGSAYRGVSINACIADAGRLARSVVSYLGRSTAGPDLRVDDRPRVSLTA
jgi:oxygen-dependent protoporphyrinogen oxidase